MAVADSEVRRALQTEIESATAKLVFLSLARDGAASVATLQDRLDEPRIRLYGVLESLVERDLVTERRTGEGRMYDLAL